MSKNYVGGAKKLHINFRKNKSKAAQTLYCTCTSLNPQMDWSQHMWHSKVAGDALSDRKKILKWVAKYTSHPFKNVQ